MDWQTTDEYERQLAEEHKMAVREQREIKRESTRASDYSDAGGTEDHCEPRRDNSGSLIGLALLVV